MNNPRSKSSAHPRNTTTFGLCLCLCLTFGLAGKSLAETGIKDLPFQPVGISANGLKVLGPNAIWDENTETTTALTAGFSATAISAEGTVVAGSSGGQAARWENGSATQLGILTGGAGSEAKGISNDGNTIVGESGSTNGQRGFLWPANLGSNTGLVELPPLPGSTHSVATAVFRMTGGTKRVVGYSYGASPLTTARATYWNVAIISGGGPGTHSAGSPTVMPVPAGSPISLATAISRDGERHVGLKPLSGAGFLWDDPGVASQSGFSNVFGVSDLWSEGPPWTDERALGTIIVGQAPAGAAIWDSPNGVRDLKTVLTSLGYNMANWIVFDKAVAITPDGLTIVGTGLNGATFAQGWRVSVGRSLVRVGTADLQRYRRFDPGRDGWSFQNAKASTFPAPDYDDYNGTDFFTGKAFPRTFRSTTNPAASDFASWSVWLGAFGPGQLYNGSGMSATYKTEAMNQWKLKKGNWAGSCFGYAMSSLMIFANKSMFESTFSAMGSVGDNLFALPSTSPRRLVINRLMTRQHSRTLSPAINADRGLTPSATLDKIIAEFESETRNESGLGIRDCGGHAIVAYMVSKDDSDPNKWRVYVYDSNIPGDRNQFVDVNLATQRWTYSGLNCKGTPWGGSREFYLMTPLSDYWGAPGMKDSRSKSNHLLEFHPRGDLDVIIEGIGAATDTIGVVDSLAINTFPDADYFYELNGQPSLPIYYEVPKDDGNKVPIAYGATLSDIRGAEVALRVVDGDSRMGFERFDGQPGQSDEVACDGTLFEYQNPDGLDKLVNLECSRVMGSETRSYILRSFIHPGGAVTEITTPNNDEIQITHMGSTATTYDLEILRITDTSEEFFTVNDVPIDGNSSQRVLPDWTDLENQMATISTDTNLDGTFEGSFQVMNDPATSVPGDLPSGTPRRHVLTQNHPNPFNPTTQISFGLPEAARVTLEVFSASGRRVAVLLSDEARSAGYHSVTFDASDLPSGIYFYRLEGDGFSETRKMALVK